MPIVGGSLVRVHMVMRTFGQTAMNVWDYEVGGIETEVNAGDLAESWWNHTKGAYRALAQTFIADSFISVRVTELENVYGAAGEYAVPVGERAGTRTNQTIGDGLPPFNAAGVRLTVGSRLTRPGQKRIPFVLEGDQLDGALQSTFTTLVTNLMDVMTVSMTLGAPAALTVLTPIIVGQEASGAVRAFQPITGYAVNPSVTSQVSRKIGRGI